MLHILEQRGVFPVAIAKNWGSKYRSLLVVWMQRNKSLLLLLYQLLQLLLVHVLGRCTVPHI